MAPRPSVFSTRLRALTIFYTLDGTQPGTSVGGSTMQYFERHHRYVDQDDQSPGHGLGPDHQRNGRAPRTHRIASGDADFLAGRRNLQFSAKRNDFFGPGRHNLLYHQRFNSYQQLRAILRTDHGSSSETSKPSRPRAASLTAMSVQPRSLYNRWRRRGRYYFRKRVYCRVHGAQWHRPSISGTSLNGDSQRHRQGR